MADSSKPTYYVDEEIGVDSTDGADGSTAKPYKTVSFAYLQHADSAQYLVKNKDREGDGKEEWKPASKAALKKAVNYADQQKKKAGKEKELAIRQKKEQEDREKALEETKKIVIKEDESLPKATRINLGETRPEVVKLGSGERTKEVDYASPDRGTRVKVFGRVHRERKQAQVLFVTLRDGFGYLQCVLTGPLAKTYDAVTLTRETSMMITGEMWEVPPGAHAPDNRELHADYFEIIGKAPGGDDAITNKVQEKGDPQTLLDQRHLVLRGEKAAAVMFVRSAVEHAFHTKYHELNYIKVSPPALVQTQVEGGSTLFEFDYYSEKAYLTQSSQLYLETALPFAGNVYCIEKSFRAEKSLTRRHLSEYTHVEAELDFITFDDLLNHLEDVICSVIDLVLAQPRINKMIHDLNPKFQKPSRPFKRMRYADAITWLNDHGINNEDDKPHEFGDDIAEAAERRMTDILDVPVLLTYFPVPIKSFYMTKDPEDERVTESVDLLIPGVGEIVGGSMRMHDYEELMEAYKRNGIPPEPYYWYTDQRSNGMYDYGRFAALSNLEEEEDDDREEDEVDDNDVGEVTVTASHEESEALALEGYDSEWSFENDWFGGTDLPFDFLQDFLQDLMPSVPNFCDTFMFEPDILCHNCQTVFLAEGRDGMGHLRVDVTNAARCRLCEALLNVWTPELHSDHYLDLEFEFVPRDGYYSSSSDSIRDVIFRPKPCLLTAPRTARFGVQKLKDKDSDEDYPKIPFFNVDPPTSTRSKDSGMQIKRWLKDCEGHEACRDMSSEAEFIPSRLLEITRDADGTALIRLIFREDLSHPITYATLSHCWGSVTPLRLEEAKMTPYRKRIPREEMSPVFRDAIDVSVALNIWYIWIDSLCIIQDSKEDWHTQSAMMCDIYSHCHVNIAADGAEDGSWGLFRGRGTALMTPMQIAVAETNGTPFKDNRRFSAMEPDNYLLFDIHCWKHEVDDSPLGRRGWVIQERALSPRTIHFGKTQIAWECRHKTCNDVFPDGFVRGTIQRRAKDFLSTEKTTPLAVRLYKELKGWQDHLDKLEKENRLRRAGGRPFTPSHPKNGYNLPKRLRPYQLAGLEDGLLDELRLAEGTKAEI
ncbi:hypothetical protein LTR17_025485 [Elasticomyces elasticus]|nr:hypothetical protein LTR17_025485 [Elasticomyces elasticus]